MDRVTQAGFTSRVSGLQPLTLPMEGAVDHTPPEEDTSDTRFSGRMSPHWIVAFIAGLTALWLIRNASEHLRSNAIAVSAFNFLAVFLMAALGFVLLKILVSIVPVPGLTALAHAL
jgi:hypothetical protein